MAILRKNGQHPDQRGNSSTRHPDQGVAKFGDQDDKIQTMAASIPENKTLTAVDLFSGCGGLTLGLKKAGFKVLGAVEIQELEVETYMRNHPDVLVWHDDIRNVSPRRFLQALGIRPGDLDLLAGCPPCQGFSSLRTLNGNVPEPDSDLNDLIFEFLRFTKLLKPHGIMLENVPGLVSNPRFAHLLAQLDDLGYSVIYDVLDAADYGVPQRRKRLILSASRGEVPQFARRSSQKRTVRQAISNLPKPGKSGDELHDFPEQRAPHVLEMIRKIPRNGGSRGQLPSSMVLECHRRCSGFSDVYGRMAWDDVSPTITGGCISPSKGRFLHPTQHRAITLREAALLQSFPATYHFSLDGGKYAAAQMIGNALPPEFIRRNAKALRRALNHT